MNVITDFISVEANKHNLKNTLSRIIDGYYKIKVKKYTLKVKPPSIKIEASAERYHNYILENLKYDDADSWLDENRRYMILQKYGIWNLEQNKDIEQKIKDIDKLKVELYKHYSLADTRSLIKDNLLAIQKDIDDLHHKKYTFYEHTKESYASLMKNRYIVENTVYYKNRLFFKGLKRNKLYYHNRIASLVNDLSIKDIRQVVHMEQWKMLWEASKTMIFNKPIIECNQEQKIIISVSQMIDNVRQHPNCPSEDILRDSDALDGWIIYQNEKQEQERKKQTIENSLTSKHKNANEVFVMAKSPEEIKNIMAMNDPQTRQDIRQMHKHVREQKKEVKWQDIPSIRQKAIREHKSEKL